MKALNVLLVTYAFPPMGGVGVLRAASLARYFPPEEIRLDVLTTRNASAVGSDPTLLEEIPIEVKIHRTVALDLPFGIKKGIKKLITGTRPPSQGCQAAAGPGNPSFLKRALQDVLLPDPQVTWLPILTRAAHRIVRERNIELVLVTVPPFSSALLVAKLRKSFPSLPIAIEFRDEWLSSTIDLVSFSRSERAIKFAANAEADAVAKATTVVAVTEAARQKIRSRYPAEPDSKFQLISNGFDATGLRGIPPSVDPRPRDRIVVTYTGSIYGSTEPGALVEALRTLPAEVRSRFRLRFIGHIEEPRFRESLLQLGDMVELKGFLPQNEALAAMCDSDYALLITHDPLNVSAKFYDYIGAGMPILATVHPDGEVRRLMEALRAGWWAGSRDVEGIRKLFMDAAARGNSVLSEFDPDTERIAQYEREVLAKRYASLLHSIAGRQRQAAPDAWIGDLVGSAR